MVLLNEQGNRVNLPLATKKGRQIPNEQRDELSRSIKDAAREQVRQQHPAVRLRSLSSAYNCMGMVFANRRVWIDPDWLGMILADDGYSRVRDERELQPGDVAVYRSSAGAVSHVGLVAEVKPNLREGTWEVQVLSQWGSTGEYFHRVDDLSPALGHFSGYWTERI